jgi:hypothetical protein
MTPKEKAEQLVDKFMAIKSMKLSDYSLIYYPFAKLCALEAVDEMISVLTDLNGIYNITPALTYWQEVKQEIEKL